MSDVHVGGQAATSFRGAGPRAARTFIRTFKIMPRSSNAHAYVNAGFLAEVDVDNSFKIIGKPTVVFGGISSTFTHAAATETFLTDKNMNDHAMFLEAVNILEGELIPDNDPVLASPQYRKQLAVGLFYKVQNNFNPLTNVIGCFISSSCMCLVTQPLLMFRAELTTLCGGCPVASRTMTRTRACGQCPSPRRR